MILEGRLHPGERVGQGSLADALEMSRIPVREALSVLASEGLLTHVPNSGYRVARLNQSEFQQVYLMRTALEDTLLQRVPDVSASVVARLADINNRISDASDRLDVGTMVSLNFEFHFGIFSLARLPLVVDELHRLWARATPYQSFFYYDRAARDEVISEHRQAIEALASGNNKQLVKVMHRHRRGSESHMERLLPLNDDGVDEGEERSLLY